MAGRRTTLADVAARAGVSVTTASYILNGRTVQMRISPDTERRVQTAMAELEYRPNRSARNLRSSSTLTFGVISDQVASGHFASSMISGAGRAARAVDHLLLIGETDGDPDVEARFIEELVERQVDGIVYATVSTTRFTVPPALRDQNAVLLNCLDPRSGLPSVLPDEVAGGRVAAELMLRSGTGSRVWVVGRDPEPAALAGPWRMEGIRAGFTAAGHDELRVVDCAWRVVAAYDALRGLLASEDPPAGLICLNDRIAMGAYQALQEMGLRIPDDVAVVSFDGSELAGWLRPALTSVSVPYAEMGAIAIRALSAGVGEAPQVTRLPMPVLRGQSLPPGVI